MNKKLKITIVLILIAFVTIISFYLTECNSAQIDATKYLNGTATVNVTKTDNALFLDGYGNDTALIFYPGAKNDYVSYLPMFIHLAEKGVDSYILKMPFNIAFFGENKAEPIINNTNYSHYILSGHSLGGLSAAAYASHSGNGDGVVIISGYPLDEVNKPVLSIYGSEDGVLNKKAYNEAKPKMKNLTEFVIEGGNHAQFGYYGKQIGDNDAKISPEDQQAQAVEKILEFIDKVI